VKAPSLAYTRGWSLFHNPPLPLWERVGVRGSGHFETASRPRSRPAFLPVVFYHPPARDSTLIEAKRSRMGIPPWRAPPVRFDGLTALRLPKGRCLDCGQVRIDKEYL